MTWQDIAATIGWAGALAVVPMAVAFFTAAFIGYDAKDSRVVTVLTVSGWVLAFLIIVAWFASLLITGFNGGLA